MYRRKRYGESQILNCPFCGSLAHSKNKQGVPVCSKHKERELANLKCICGEELEVRESKWGAYFFCINCGNLSFNKGMEANPQIKQNNQEKKEIVIRSDEVDFS